MKVIKYLVLCFCLVSVAATAQNTMTSSPYSMFGIGDISTGIYGQNVGMGNTSYGLRKSNFMNLDNPAGLTAIDSGRMFIETSLFLKNEYYRSGGTSNTSLTGNMSAFSIGGRIVPRWYMAVGLTPYSSVGYYFNSKQPLEGTTNSYYVSTFEGEGGLYRIYTTQAFALTPNLSFGTNLSFIIGNMSQSESQSSMSVTQDMNTHTFYADFGLQYNRRLRKNMALTWGAVYGYKQPLNINNTLTIISSLSTTERTKKTIKQNIPAYVGTGGALDYKNCTYALDYTYRKYSSLKADGSSVRFKDTHEVRLGACYDPQGRSSESLLKRMAYKGGFTFSNSYMSISGKTGYQIRGTAGLEFPVYSGKINMSFFYDRTNLEQNVFRRDLTGIVLTYTISELFYKVKY